MKGRIDCFDRNQPIAGCDLKPMCKVNHISILQSIFKSNTSPLAAASNLSRTSKPKDHKNLDQLLGLNFPGPTWAVDVLLGPLFLKGKLSR